jgi:ubiquitin carboxyl-terminal hydrolase 30
MGKCHSPFHGTLASYLIQSTSLKKLPIKYDGFESISVSMPRQWEPNEQCFHNQFNSMPNFSMRCVLTLQQCLHHYIKSESVDFKSDEVLSGTSNSTTYSKKLMFGKLPKCLAIHIQRIYWHNSGIPFKDNTYVQFPDMLDMSPYIHRNTLSKRCYRLVAVICHAGDAFSGHFITYRHLSVNPSATNYCRQPQWVYTSDNAVRPASYQEVSSATAYMLFYEKSTDHTSL